MLLQTRRKWLAINHYSLLMRCECTMVAIYIQRLSVINCNDAINDKIKNGVGYLP